MFRSPKHCCRNCHFLAKTFNDGERTLQSSWNQEERSNLYVKNHYAAECAEDVWSTGVSPQMNANLNEVLLQDRGDSCFFFEIHEGMSFSAARKLWRIRNDNRQLKRSYKYTQIGLWIAAISTLLGLFAQIAKAFGCLPLG